LLEKAYSPMTIRFFILQTHYRSTLDFGNEALQAAEKGMKRLWEANEVLMKMNSAALPAKGRDSAMEEKVKQLLQEMDEFMNDDFNTAKVLANMFELVPVINGIKDKHIAADALGSEIVELFQKYFKLYLHDILGIVAEVEKEDGKLDGVIGLLIEIRKEAKARKDYATSDKIRLQLQQLGIQLKDEKDGSVSYALE
jgi:cysteinyl-tRNA synthetase